MSKQKTTKIKNQKYEGKLTNQKYKQNQENSGLLR
jgi:hypothetical protein